MIAKLPHNRAYKLTKSPSKAKCFTRQIYSGRSVQHRLSRRLALQEVSTPVTEVVVKLAERSYPIYIGEGLLDRGDILRSHIHGKQVLIVTNETVGPLYLERCRSALQGLQVEVVALPDGEQYKDLATLSKVWDEALSKRLNRGCTFLALGGGVVGDMAGFAAAAYQRGVKFIQVPTTVMATVDSSVGGKTGVNHPLGKNMIGAFHQPQCVLIDIQTLNSLPPREHASGISEIVKYGLIRDPALFSWLEANMQRLLDKDSEALSYAIERSCINKAEVVAADEREGGMRALLNLGHTFGHAMETWTGYGTWLHGEAVAAGMVMAADLSYRLGWIQQDVLLRTRRLLEQAELPVTAPQGMKAEDFMQLMAVDKKAVDGQLRLVLLRGPLGQALVTAEYDPQALQSLLDDYCP